jgi:hypothetical protein
VTANFRASFLDTWEMVRSRLRPERMGGRVARSSFKTIIVNGVGAAISFAVQIMLSNLLGKDLFGTYLIAMGWLAVAQLCGLLELDVTAVRFVGSYVATERWSLLRGFLRVVGHFARRFLPVAAAEQEQRCCERGD